MKDTLAPILTAIIIVIVLICVTVLLVLHIIDFTEVGPFLLVLVAPLTALAGLPLFTSALKAPTPEQADQIHALAQQQTALTQQHASGLSQVASQLASVVAQSQQQQAQPPVQVIANPLPQSTQVQQDDYAKYVQDVQARQPQEPSRPTRLPYDVTGPPASAQPPSAPSPMFAPLPEDTMPHAALSMLQSQQA